MRYIKLEPYEVGTNLHISAGVYCNRLLMDSPAIFIEKPASDSKANLLLNRGGGRGYQFQIPKNLLHHPDISPYTRAFALSLILSLPSLSQAYTVRCYSAGHLIYSIKTPYQPWFYNNELNIIDKYNNAYTWITADCVVMK